MKWFMSYVNVYANGRFDFCHEVNEEHPLISIKHYNEKFGKDRYKVILLSFQQVDDSFENTDEMSSII